jgi:hypothetical protein
VVILLGSNLPLLSNLFWLIVTPDGALIVYPFIAMLIYFYITNVSVIVFILAAT